MKTAGADLIALLAGKNQYVMKDTYTFTLADGTVLTYTDGGDVNSTNTPVHDPYWVQVRSLLNFRTSVTLPGYPAGFPSFVTQPLDTFADPKGTIWTIYGNCHSPGAVVGIATPDIPPNYPQGDGYLYCPEYQVDDSFSNAVMQSANLPLGGVDDFTIEFDHDENGGGIYHTSSSATMLGGYVANSTGPQENGEWSFVSYFNTGIFKRYVQFRLMFNKGASVSFVAVGTDPFVTDIPFGVGVVRRFAVTRKDGVLRMFLNGKLVGTQNMISYPVNHQALFPKVTFGGWSDGTSLLPNSYGVGKYSRWRFTAACRYTADYVPSPGPFPVS